MDQLFKLLLRILRYLRSGITDKKFPLQKIGNIIGSHSSVW